MATLPENAETTGRVLKYMDAIEEYLMAHGWAQVEELETMIRERHEDEWTDDDTTPVKRRKGKGERIKWLNDIDWARAHLTRRGRIITQGRMIALMTKTLGHLDITTVEESNGRTHSIRGMLLANQFEVAAIMRSILRRLQPATN